MLIAFKGILFNFFNSDLYESLLQNNVSFLVGALIDFRGDIVIVNSQF